jgi:acyl carrier protein
MDHFFVLQEVFRQVFDDDAPITPETNRQSVAGWDSVAQVKLILALEEEFGIRFTEDEVSSIESVGDFLRAIEAAKVRPS